jgi:alpha-glucosidase
LEQYARLGTSAAKTMKLAVEEIEMARLPGALLSAAILGFTLAGGALSQTAKDPLAVPKQSNADWWKNAVIYQIYPRSFQDSNGDGIGDLNGITQRLDYLQQLGVDAIWLSPVYPSPQVDFGYDISDYENIDSRFGTLADFDHLIAEANKRHIRVIMDMVMNHSSDEHKWFIESRSSRTNPYRDWYVWHDGKGETATDKGDPPNNWESGFGHSAWTWDETTRQYYYHKFHVKQPDLNWNNPQVHEAFKQILRFWLDRGVAGFRFDAITALYEDPELRDENVIKDKNGNPVINWCGDVQLDGSKTDNLPGEHAVVAEMRATMDSYNPETYPGTRLALGETYVFSAPDLARLYGTSDKPEFHLPMDTQLAFINKLDVAAFREKMIEAETQIGGNVPMLLFDNHDNDRMVTRYGDGVHDLDIQRGLAAILLAARGASLVYYGDEIGMQTTPPVRKEDVKDPIGLLAWPKAKGRDGERTPMQWDATASAGFTVDGVTPWLPASATYLSMNVAAASCDPNSLLAWYRALIRLKKTNVSLAQGENTMLDIGNEKVLSWLRTAPGTPGVVISVNFTAEPQSVDLSFSGASGKVKTLLKTPGARNPLTLRSIELEPFGVFIGELQ